MDEIERLAQLIIEAKKTVVFTGAGVSTESGIPDFRGPGGIWSRYDPEDFTIQRFLSSPAARNTLWRMSAGSGLLAEAEPNPAHYAIAELYRLGKLDCVITQNIDSLHQKAGVPEDRVFELHGNTRWAVCLTCHRRFPMSEILQRIREVVEIPDCPDCQGILKPDAVLFGEALPHDVLQEATRRSRNCNLFIVIGSTLVVYPAAYMPTYALEAGASLAIVNLTPTPLDRQATVVIHSEAGKVMPKVVERVRLF
ncbi:MAG: SIR2 family NAD-dependent protein deacylase [Dehalococcoidia bacterium]